MLRALLLTYLATAILAGTPAKKTTHSKTSASESSKASTAKVATTNSSHHSSSHGRTKKAARAKPAPTYQLHPDPERYRQIQQALADRGYFKGEVNGEWKDDSVDAMRRFQSDQKLDNDGKIDALSLTGLGLGPKHDGTTAATVPLSSLPNDPIPDEGPEGSAANSPPQR